MEKRNEMLDRVGSRSAKAGSAGVGDGLSMGGAMPCDRMIGDGELMNDNVAVDGNGGFSRAVKKETYGPVAGGFEISGGMNG